MIATVVGPMKTRMKLLVGGVAVAQAPLLSGSATEHFEQ
jgi:hypothetical protein